jgi:hypothetical protein
LSIEVSAIRAIGKIIKDPNRSPKFIENYIITFRLFRRCRVDDTKWILLNQFQQKVMYRTYTKRKFKSGLPLLFSSTSKIFLLSFIGTFLNLKNYLIHLFPES